MTLQWRHVFAPLWLRLLGSGHQPNDFLAQDFFGNQAIIRVFRVLDWLSSISGAEIMAQKAKLGKKCNPHERWPSVYYTHMIYGHNSPAGWARELFKPSKDGESLLVYNKKHCFSFGCRLHCLCLHDGSMFVHIRFTFPWRHQLLGADQRADFVAQSFIGF